MIRLFRTVAYAEGLSFLILLGIAMPLKYIGGMPEYVRVVGALHGGLFLAYFAGVIYFADHHEWSKKKTLYGLIASVLPFGTFVFDRRYFSKT
jgi:integral membrane protein